MKARIAIILAGLVLMSGSALAQRGNNYFGMSLGDANFKSIAGVEQSTTSMTLKLGRDFLPFLGVEFHAAMSSLEVFTDPEIVYGGAFVRLSIPTEKTRTYILGGKARMNFDFNAALKSNKDDEEAEFAGGIGVELYGSERTALTFEAMRYGIKDEDPVNKLDVFSLGFVRRF